MCQLCIVLKKVQSWLLNLMIKMIWKLKNLNNIDSKYQSKIWKKININGCKIAAKYIPNKNNNNKIIKKIAHIFKM